MESDDYKSFDSIEEEKSLNRAEIIAITPQKADYDDTFFIQLQSQISKISNLAQIDDKIATVKQFNEFIKNYNQILQIYYKELVNIFNPLIDCLVFSMNEYNITLSITITKLLRRTLRTWGKYIAEYMDASVFEIYMQTLLSVDFVVDKYTLQLLYHIMDIFHGLNGYYTDLLPEIFQKSEQSHTNYSICLDLFLRYIDIDDSDNYEYYYESIKITLTSIFSKFKRSWVSSVGEVIQKLTILTNIKPEIIYIYDENLIDQIIHEILEGYSNDFVFSGLAFLLCLISKESSYVDLITNRISILHIVRNILPFILSVNHMNLVYNFIEQITQIAPHYIEDRNAWVLTATILKFIDNFSYYGRVTSLKLFNKLMYITDYSENELIYQKSFIDTIVSILDSDAKDHGYVSIEIIHKLLLDFDASEGLVDCLIDSGISEILSNLPEDLDHEIKNKADYILNTLEHTE